MSRRKRRFENRQIKRNKNKEKRLERYNDYNDIISYQSLYDAAQKASNGVKWKESVQKYMANILMNISKTHDDLVVGNDIRKGFIEFEVNERGKRRLIKSVHFAERVVQKVICQKTLYPSITSDLIYDNGANRIGKGTHFSIERLEHHLHQFYQSHKNNGYILLIDFQKYFDNINHDYLKQLYRKHFYDERLLKLLDSFIDAFGEKGLGLGSEVNQISAVAYPNKLDHYIKEVLRVKGYGRYMDDSYLIHHDKKFLQYALEEIKKICDELGIIVHPKKTHITDLKHGFTYLKTNFYLTNSGKVIKRPCRKSITFARRRLKRQVNLVNKGILTVDQIRQSVLSWLGSLKNKKAYFTIKNIEKLFYKLYKEPLRIERPTDRISRLKRFLEIKKRTYKPKTPEN